MATILLLWKNWNWSWLLFFFYIWNHFHQRWMSLIVAPPPNGSAWFWWWCWWIGSVTPSRRSPETNVIVNKSYRLVVVGYNLKKLQNNVNNVKSEIQIYLFFITRDVKKVFCAWTPKKYLHGTNACKAALFLCLIIHRGQKTALIFFLT